MEYLQKKRKNNDLRTAIHNILKRDSKNDLINIIKKYKLKILII